MASPTHQTRSDSRARLLDAALRVIRTKGYTATTVDDICSATGLTKGSFFHHFSSKEELALAAAEHFGQMAASLFSSAPYRQIQDPRDRVLGYLDFRAALLRGDLPEFTCLLGTMVQETFESHPAIRAACRQGIFGHASEVAHDLALAKAAYAPTASWDPQSLANFTQAVIQGSFILAKADHAPEVAVGCMEHLRRYVRDCLSSPAQGTAP